MYRFSNTGIKNTCDGSNRISSIISLTGESSKVCTSTDATQHCRSIYIYTILEEWIVAIRSNKIDRDKPSWEAELFHDLSLFSLLVFLNYKRIKREVKSQIKIHELRSVSVQFIRIIMINYTYSLTSVYIHYVTWCGIILAIYNICVYKYVLKYSDYFLSYQDNIENFYFLILFCNSKCIAICVSMLCKNYLEKKVNDSSL